MSVEFEPAGTAQDQGLKPHIMRVKGPRPGKPADGSGTLEPLSNFMTNLAGSAIVNAIGPIRQIVQGEADLPRSYLVIVPASTTEPVKPVQVQVD